MSVDVGREGTTLDAVTFVSCVHQVRYEQKAFWINKTGAMFTIGFSVIFLCMLGATNGTQTISYLDNITNDQYYVPGFIAYGIMAACFSMLDEQPREPTRDRTAQATAPHAIAGVGVALGDLSQYRDRRADPGGGVTGHRSIRLRRGHFPRWLAFLIVVVVGIACFTAMGVAISSVIPNQETAGPVTSVAFFVLLFLSGLWFPLPPHSGLETFSTFFPVRHFLIAVARAL